MHVARSKHFLPPLSFYRVMLMVPVRKHSAGRQKFPNKHRPHFTKTSTDTYLVLTVAKMPLRLLKVTQLTVMVSFWWGKSSVTSLSLKTSALKLFTEADLLYQLSLLNQIILFQLSLPTPPLHHNHRRSTTVTYSLSDYNIWKQEVVWHLLDTCKMSNS